MIGKDDMMGVLLESCPSFLPQWRAFQIEWEDPNERPLYLALAEFSRHLIGRLEQGDTDHLNRAFSAIERLHVEGDDYVKEAATVGLLESLQNSHLHQNGTDPEQFRSYLGPDSAKWWIKLIKFWETGEILAEG